MPRRWIARTLTAVAVVTSIVAVPHVALAVTTPAGYPAAGIDVSSHDHALPLDWSQVAASGVRFAYVKATEGTGYLNPYFASDYAAARTAGLSVGAYAFARPDLGNPVGQADHFVAQLGWSNDAHTLVPFVDLEWPYGALNLGPCWNLTPSQLTSWIRAFLNRVKAAIGRAPMIYTNTNWWNPCTGYDSSFGGYPLDIAGYGSSPPPLPSGWQSFAVWQYAAGDPRVAGSYDSDVVPGGTLGIAALAGPWRSSVFGDLTGDRWPDLLARQTSDGGLYLYPGDGAWFGATRSVTGWGWNTLDTITRLGDANRDGFEDVFGRETATGNLWLYPGNAAGTFDTRVYFGAGWNTVREITATGDFDFDGYADVVAVDTASGALYLYPGNASGSAFATRRTVNWGWNTVDEITGVGDFNGDGYPDLVAREIATGYLFLYPGTGTGIGDRTYLGGGWNSVRSLAGIGDVNGDGYVDLLAVDKATGALSLYPGTGTGLSGRVTVGTGWTGLAPIL